MFKRISLGLYAVICSIFCITTLAGCNTKTVTKAEIQNGDVRISNEMAKAGEEVFLTYTADPGYEFVCYNVKTETNQVVEVENNIFVMPEQKVIVGATFEAIDYTITIQTITGGTVSADKQIANIGNIVTLSNLAEQGYRFCGYVVKTESNQIVNVVDNKFTMPCENITVSAVFNVLHDITLVQAQNGTISSFVNVAVQGEKVELSASADTGYVLKEFIVKDEQQNPIVVNNNSFEMPNDNVVVTALFDLEYPYTQGLSFKYVQDTSKYYTVTGYTGSSTDVVIPEKYYGPEGCYEVNVISANAFSSNTTIQNVYIPKTIKQIGDTAFNGCTGLIDVVFTTDSTLLTLGNNVFKDCTSLVNVDFENCSNLSAVGTSIFAGCTSVEDIYIPELCNTLIVAPNVKNIYVHKDNQTFSVVDGVVYNKDKTILKYYPVNKDGISFEVPAYVQEIGASAFARNINLNTVTFAQNCQLKTVGEYAFSYMNITSIEIPESVETFGVYAGTFRGCSLLQSVVFKGESIYYITEHMFQDCVSLTNVVLPKQSVYIGYRAFAYCTSLTSINLTEMHSIGEAAFKSCSKLETITIPNTVSKLYASVFENCTSLTEVNFEENAILDTLPNVFSGCTSLTKLTLPKGLTSFSSDILKSLDLTSIEVQEGCENFAYYGDMLMDTEQTRIIFCKNKSIETYTVPATVTKIDNKLFNNSSLKSITFSSALSVIGYHAFYGCENLTSVIIPKSIETIDVGAFALSGLTSVTFEEGGTNNVSLGSGSFKSTKITTIKLVKTITYVYNGVFDSCDSLTSIEVENSSYKWTERYWDGHQVKYLTRLVDLSDAEANVELFNSWRTEVIYNSKRAESE